MLLNSVMLMIWLLNGGTPSVWTDGSREQYSPVVLSLLVLEYTLLQEAFRCVVWGTVEEV